MPPITSRRAGWRPALCAGAALVLTLLAPAAPAAADSITGNVRLASGEGLGTTDDFNDVSTDGGSTWADAVIVVAQPGYATIPGTQWISSDADAGVSRESTTTLFRRSFSLPPGVVATTGQICVHADNGVIVEFNGTSVLSQPDTADPGNFSGDPSCASIAGIATSGANRFDFAVPNSTGPLGLDFEVSLTYAQDPDAPPTLRLPADLTVAATSPSGATVPYGDVPAIDVTGGTMYATCTPSSGSLFAVGTTTVVCSAAGTNGQVSTGSFAVTVSAFVGENLPPVLSLPDDITLSADSTSGRTVDYQVSASDDSSTSSTIECTPAPGSLFPVGVTTVTCTATDDQQATTSGSFTVTIVGPLQRACSLLQASLGITLKSRLVTTLNRAADALHQAGRDRDARTIRNLAQQVKNSPYTYIRPALRTTVRNTVTKVMARACCSPALPDA